MSSYIFPASPQEVQCTKCGKNTEVALNPGKPGVDSECKLADCPVARDHQPSGSDGTLIYFTEVERERIPFNHEDQAETNVMAACDDCGWTGDSTEYKHLAGQVICPVCKLPSLFLVDDDEPGIDV